MVARWLELIGGLLIALMTLRDVFETVVVPGGSQATLKVARRSVFVLLPVWKRVHRKSGISPAFAPFMLVATFIVWMALLALGFGMMAHALRHSFNPALASFPDALYVAASSIVTVGLSETDATGPARWVVVGAGFCGLASLTMAVTYLLMVQSSVTKRDVGIIKLNTSAGVPPSAVTFLENYATTGNRSELAHVLREARDWCTTVRQSHASHPSLIYFRSVSTGPGWPAALGALLDLALIVQAMLADDELRGAAVLLRADGLQMAEELGRLVALEPEPSATTEDELRQVSKRLTDAGYELRSDFDRDRLLHERAANVAWVDAMASHLGTPTARLLPQA